MNVAVFLLILTVHLVCWSFCAVGMAAGAQAFALGIHRIRVRPRGDEFPAWLLLPSGLALFLFYLAGFIGTFYISWSA